MRIIGMISKAGFAATKNGTQINRLKNKYVNRFKKVETGRSSD
jgi:hypothetical protein